MVDMPGGYTCSSQRASDVVDLGRPRITSIATSGTNAVMTFTWALDEATSVFRVQRATVVTGPYADVSTASIVRIVVSRRA